MSDKSKTRILITNERVKAVAGIFFNLATALLIAIVLRVYERVEIDVKTVGFSVIVAMLIFLGYKILLVLETEEW